jgi:hypothetical protein
MTTKICKICNQEKVVDCFSKRKRSKDGMQTSCKDCMKNMCSRWYQNNKEDHAEYNKQWIESNKEQRKQQQKQYYQTNREKHKQQMKDWYLLNRERANAKSKQWQSLNKNRMRLNAAEYSYKRLKKDINYKLIKILRTRLYNALKNSQKKGSAVKDLGCTIQELKVYLESKFLPGMSWENYGLHGWHIDHIVPLSRFNLEDAEQLKKACHYTNLQPLWAEDNLVKSNKTILSGDHNE